MESLGVEQLRAIAYWEDAIRYRRADPEHVLIDAGDFFDRDDAQRTIVYVRRLRSLLERARQAAVPSDVPAPASATRPYVFKGTERYHMLELLRENIEDLLRVLHAWAYLDAGERTQASVFDSQDDANRAIQRYYEFRSVAWRRVRAKLDRSAGR